MMGGVQFADIRLGDQIPPLIRHITNVQLFRFSAVTWNAHRIHYDKEYAQSEGYPDILVQSHLHGAFLAQMLTDWTNPYGRLSSLEWSNRRFATVGDTLVFKGTVTQAYEKDGTGYVQCEIREENEKGEVAVPGEATLVFSLETRHGEG